MIDTIRIYSDNQLVNRNFNIKVLSNIVVRENQYGRYKVGFIGSFRVSISDTRITISGSLSKFYLGNNYENMSRYQVGEALFSLSLLLRLNIYNFIISRLDIGATIALSSECSYYLNCLIELARYQMVTYANETRMFRNKVKTLVFYDKKSEMSDQLKVDSANLSRKEGNLLRYEMQIKKVSKVLGKIPVIKLNDDKFIREISDHWIGGYKKIKKNHRLVNINKIIIKKPQDFYEYLIGSCVENLGMENILSVLSVQVKSKKLDKRRKSDIKKKLLSINKKFSFTATYCDELESELLDIAAGWR